jgi:hypothetical protein
MACKGAIGAKTLAIGRALDPPEGVPDDGSMGPLSARLLGGLLTVLLVASTSASCGGATDANVENAVPTSDGGYDATTSVCRPQECPGVDTECSQRTCVDNACAATLPPAGTRIKVQKAGDCKVDECDGKGSVVSVPDDTDKVADANPCTIVGCNAGALTSTAAVKGVPCGTALACDGEGSCVGCTAPTDCSAPRWRRSA